jgi:tRNA-uridine 2-sulfurtransferase
MSKVLLAMSGGVDSTVAASLLADQGYEVIGVTFKNFNLNELAPTESKRNCCSIELINNARQACSRLGIPHYVIDRVEIFKLRVLDNFRDSYLTGMTPNPCVRCNSLVRWPELISLADQMGAEFVATGHYARIGRHNGECRIFRAISIAKDQSYALWGINPEHLPRTILPIGDYAKDKIRQIAAERDFKSAEQPDSQDICFVPEGKYSDLFGKIMSGDIVDTQGEIVGRHKGLANYTIGQRRGLGIANPKPLYVINILAEQNKIVVGAENELYRRKFELGEANWFIKLSANESFECQTKIRYRHDPSQCKVKIGEQGQASVEFAEPQRAITPGQSAVFYDQDMVLGGGVIISVSLD